MDKKPEPPPAKWNLSQALTEWMVLFCLGFAVGCMVQYSTVKRLREEVYSLRKQLPPELRRTYRGE
jgi:hypothetical protein